MKGENRQMGVRGIEKQQVSKTAGRGAKRRAEAASRGKHENEGRKERGRAPRLAL